MSISFNKNKIEQLKRKKNMIEIKIKYYENLIEKEMAKRAIRNANQSKNT